MELVPVKVQTRIVARPIDNFANDLMPKNTAFRCGAAAAEGMQVAAADRATSHADEDFAQFQFGSREIPSDECARRQIKLHRKSLHDQPLCRRWYRVNITTFTFLIFTITISLRRLFVDERKAWLHNLEHLSNSGEALASKTLVSERAIHRE